MTSFPFRSLGVHAAFQPRGEFSGMMTNPRFETNVLKVITIFLHYFAPIRSAPVSVGDVKHKAIVQVDKEGTVGAAATGERRGTSRIIT